jgi:hypothetical protein
MGCKLNKGGVIGRVRDGMVYTWFFGFYQHLFGDVLVGLAVFDSSFSVRRLVGEYVDCFCIVNRCFAVCHLGYLVL